MARRTATHVYTCTTRSSSRSNEEKDCFHNKERRVRETANRCSDLLLRPPTPAPAKASSCVGPCRFAVSAWMLVWWRFSLLACAPYTRFLKGEADTSGRRISRSCAACGEAHCGRRKQRRPRRKKEMRRNRYAWRAWDTGRIVCLCVRTAQRRGSRRPCQRCGR